MIPKKFRWSLCERRHCPEFARHAGPNAKPWFSERLKQAKGDAVAMADLRAVFSRHSVHQFFRSADEEVIEGVADLLAAGRLFLHIQTVEVTGGVATDGLESSVAFPIAERRARTPSSSPRQTTPDPATFPNNTNQNAQAAVLVDSAASGAPFCPL